MTTCYTIEVGIQKCVCEFLMIERGIFVNIEKESKVIKITMTEIKIT